MTQLPEMRQNKNRCTGFRGKFMLSTFHIIKSWFFLILLVFICTASCGYALASEELLQKAAAEMQAKNYLKAREFYREALISPQIGPLADQALFGPI